MSDVRSQTLGGLVPRRVPDAYVRAEVAAFPLTSEVAFRSAMTALEPSLDDGATASTRALWRDCEETLSEHASGWSLDRLVALRDFFWFGWPHALAASRRSLWPRAVPMHRYLQRLAEVHVEPRPGVTEVAEDAESRSLDAVTHYRWITFALPEDLLLVGTGVAPPPTRVDIEPPLLVRRLIDQGVTEIHHHIGAGMDFPLLWVSVLAVLASSALHPEALTGPGQPLGGGETLLRWLLAAAVTRCLLAQFLAARTAPSLQAFLTLVRGEVRPASYRTLERALVAVEEGDDERLPELLDLRGLYQDMYLDMHPGASRTLLDDDAPWTLDDVWRRCDPIAARLSFSAPGAGERWLMQRGLTFLEEVGGGEPDERFGFSRLFWQVLRVRCLLYRSIVQRPLTAGLQWFVRFADRAGAYRGALRAAYPEISYHVAGGGHPIGNLEVRTSPDPSAFDVAENLWNLTRSWDHVLGEMGIPPGGREPEFGVLLHFRKQRYQDARWARGAPPGLGAGTHGEPHPREVIRLGGRYSDFFVDVSTEAQAVVDLIEAVPTVLRLLRGLDVASDELSVPTWVLVPLFRYLTRRSAVAAARHPSSGLSPLRSTVHVGEDFRHLMEGLRRTYEAIQYVLPRSGGRLGHATALGVDPRLWAESVGSLMMPAEDRLWDLVFEWRVYAHYRAPVELRAAPPPQRTLRLDNDIRELSERVFRRAFEPGELAEAHHVLHQLWCPPVAFGEVEELGLMPFARALRRVDWERVHWGDTVRTILRAYRQHEAVFRRGQELVEITLEESEIAALQAVQDALRRFAGSRGIVVEVNPSSNLLIGNLLDLRNHPILRLFPPEPQVDAPPPVPIAVGSDDPVTFSTHLLREYALLYEAARGAGYPERVVHEWLAMIRQTSVDARFTEPWRPTARSVAATLLDDLDDFLQRPRTLRERAPRARDGAAVRAEQP